MNILWSIVVLDVVGLLGGAWLLWKRVRIHEPTPAQDLAWLIAWSILLAVGAIVLGGAMHHSGFAIIRLWCHVLFCVLAPLLIIRGLWWTRRRRVPFGAALIFVGLVMDGIYVYARHVEPFALETNVHVIRSPRLRGLQRPVRVAVLADLQTDDVGAYEQDALDRIDALEPDLLLLAGDYIQVFTGDAYLQQLSRLLRLVRNMKHRPPLGAFAIRGDTEWKDDVFAGTHIRMLDGEVAKIPDLPIQVLGLRYEDTFRPLRPRHWADVQAFDGLTIVLGHRPDFMLDVVAGKGRAPILGVAGHTHGGQVVVPFFGPPMTLTSLPRKFASGVHAIGESWVCVSRGVGMERLDAPRIRFLCPPEIVVLELHPPKSGL